MAGVLTNNKNATNAAPGVSDRQAKTSSLNEDNTENKNAPSPNEPDSTDQRRGSGGGVSTKDDLWTVSVKILDETTKVYPNEFEPENYYHPRVLNATIHPLVSTFFNLGHERMITRYINLNPQVSVTKLRECLHYQPTYFHWAGSDLFNVITSSGRRQMIVIETNSCPSGQMFMPLLHDNDEGGGYRMVIRSAFHELLGDLDPDVAHGDLAVVYDKNHLEASGYATMMAEEIGEPVWLVPYKVDDTDPPVRWVNRIMQIRDSSGVWHTVRACFRYLTEKPWNRIPVNSRTRILNPIVSCLAGGRNKIMANRAYELFNAELQGSGLAVRVPETINNVVKDEVPLLVATMDNHAVLKVPYTNAGQGVYTITNVEELERFMNENHHYNNFIVQSLVGKASWSSTTRAGHFYHVGTVPNRKNHTFVSDLRLMVTGDNNGFRPICIFSRRARKPLLTRIDDDPSIASWEMLGTNLSVKNENGTYSCESQRTLLVDCRDFNQLGIGIDDLTDAYIQTVLSTIAIDKMCHRLMGEECQFNLELFHTLNPDDALISEIYV